MKAEDLRPCALCGQGVMHAGVPIFWRVSFRRVGVDLGAVRRAAGMEMVMGGHVALARVFEDPDIASPLAEEHTILLCEQCASRPASVYELGFLKEQQ